MTIGQGVNKQTRIKRQSAKGTIATTGAGQIVRRTQSMFELQKETYDTSDEINSAQQLTSVRHGVQLVNGSLNGILTPGTYSDPLSAIVRRDFAAVTAITGASITVSGSGPTYTVARAAGSFLTDGIKVGMVVRLTAGSFAAGNLNKNLLVTAVTALNLTVRVLNGSSLTAEGPIASATVTVPGKVTYAPTTGHTTIYHTVEEWYPDVGHSERNMDVRFGQAQLNLPGSGNATIQFQAQGLSQTIDTTAYFTSPTAETTTESLVAACGILLVNGTAMATVTDLQMTINGNASPADGVVGSNTRPDVFVGKVKVTGQFTCYFEGPTVPNLFTNETNTSIVEALAAGTGAADDFMTLVMSKLKLTTSSPDDAETGLKRTYQFTAQLNSAGGAAVETQLTTIQIHDSQAA